MKKVFKFLVLFIALYCWQTIQAQERYCVTEEEYGNSNIPDTTLLSTFYSNSCSGTSDPSFLSSYIGNKNNYIPYPNDLHVQNVHKKIKIKVFVVDTLTNLSEYTPVYEDSIRKVFDYANAILNDINIPSKPATNICGACHIKYSRFQIELIDVVYNDIDSIWNNEEPKDSILYVMFRTRDIPPHSNGSASRGNKIKTTNVKGYVYMNNYHVDWELYQNARLFLHELGHVFGLEHLYHQPLQNQERETCDENDPDYLLDILNTGVNKWCTEDNPHGFNECDPFDHSMLCTNNIMDNRMWGYLSPMQLGIMHRSAYVGYISKYTYPVDDPSLHPWVIGEDQTWDFPFRLYQDLIIKSGTSLTITCKVFMPPNARILVEKGATLMLDEGGEITSYHSRSKWNGIELEGNKNQPPFPEHQGTLIMKNGAKVSNALNGVRNFTFDNGAQGGGIIQVENSEFINCRRAVELNDYPYYSYLHNGESQCYFHQVSFIIDDTLVYHNTSGAKEFFTAFNILGGITIKNSYFENKLSLEERTQDIRNDAVYLLSSQAVISNSKFYGFRNGIKHDTYTSTPSRSINLTSNEFRKNSTSIQLLRSSHNQIRNNDITDMISYMYEHPFGGIRLRNASGIFVNNNNNTLIHCNNKIDGTVIDESDFHHKYGIILDNNGSLRSLNVVRNNTMSNLFSGLQTQKYNKRAHINCNTFKNNHYAINVNPESPDGVLNNLGSGCEPLKSRANNKFQDNFLDILSHTSIPWHYYYWYGDPDRIPNTYGTVVVQSCYGAGGDPNYICDGVLDCATIPHIPSEEMMTIMIADYFSMDPTEGNSAVIELNNKIVNGLIAYGDYQRLIDFYENMQTQEAYRALIGLYYEMDDDEMMNSMIDSLFISREEKLAYRSYYNFLNQHLSLKLLGDSLTPYEEQFLLNLVEDSVEVSGYAHSLLAWYKEAEYSDLEIEQTYMPTEHLLFESAEDQKSFNIILKNAYPNPADDLIHLIYEISSEEVEPVLSKLEVFNIYGQRVWSQEAQGVGVFHYEVNTSNWANGVYIYKVSWGHQKHESKSKKFIID